MANIIIPKRKSIGKTRSEQEKNLNSEGWFSLNEEQIDKCRHLEKKLKDEHGSRENFINQFFIDKVK